MASASKSVENGERNSRPLHPATVHFPIAFLIITYAMDIIYGLSTHPQTVSWVHTVYDLTPYLGEISRFSYFTNTLGVAMAIPATLTGAVELMAMIKRQDLLNKLQKSGDKTNAAKRMHVKIKIGFAHALLSDVGVFAAGFNWWTRRSTTSNAPTDVNIVVSSICLPLLMLSASLGGVLVYDYGVGVRRQGATRRLKEDGKIE